MSTLAAGLAVASAVLLSAGRTGASALRVSSRTTGFPVPGIPVRDPVAERWRRRARGTGQVVFAGALTWLLGPVLVVGAAVSVFAVIRVRRIRTARQAQREIDRDLPETLDLFVVLLEAGVSLRGVVAEMGRRGPTSSRPAFAHVTARLDIGEPLTEAIVQLRTQLGPGAFALVDLVTASHRYGLPMVQVVGQLSTEARTARQRRNEALARSLPVKLSFPLVVCTLPSFVLLAIVPAVMAALTSLGSDAW